MSLDVQSRRDLILYRIGRAEQAYIEAVDSARMGYWILAINRLYYALFYISNALLIDKGITVKSHAGVIVKISQSFVKTGLLTKEDGRLLSLLQNMRCEGDYDEFVDWNEEQVAPFFSPVRQLMDKMKGMISQK